MHSRQGTVATILALMFAISMVATPAMAQGTTPQDGTETTTAPTPEAANQGQTQRVGTCNYMSLYNQTIDSVVSVRRAGGLGSGFVYKVFNENNTSYIVTNSHVVGRTDNVTVQFSQDQTRTATVVGQDVFNDLAVLRVNQTPEYVEALPVADTQPEHGRPVAALGSPFGLEETITHGIVSGLNRSMPTVLGFTIPNTIQTDAPISPGNSGGPLVTCDGQVVGVNTAGIAARGAENIGFAVSSAVINQVVPSLIDTGEFENPTLGIAAATVTPAIAEANDLNVTQGVFVVAVNETSPAANVLQGADRLKKVNGQIVPVGGDVIVAVEGQSVDTTEDLASVLLTETRPGEKVTLTIIRNGERMTVTTQVIQRPEPKPMTPRQPKQPRQPGEPEQPRTPTPEQPEQR